MTITIPPGTSSYTLSTSGTTASNAGTRGQHTKNQGLGIYITGSNDVLVNTGTIIGGYPTNGTGLTAGIVVNTATGNSVTNQSGGLIEDTYSFSAGIIFNAAAGMVTNAGTIIGGVGSSGRSGDGIVLGAGGGVTNLSTGTISGGGIYFGTKSVAGTVVNSGKILGDAVYGAVFMAKGGLITNLAGTIAANGAAYGVKIGRAAATVTNAATITGGSASGTAIIMAAVAGNRVIDKSGGVFIGGVNGGSNATMELASSASAGVLLATGDQFTNFSNLTIDQGSGWTIEGDSSLSAEFATIGGFTTGDTISLTGLTQTPTTFSSSVGTISGTIETSVTIKAASTGLETLTLLGSIASMQLDFVASSTSTLTEIPVPPTLTAGGTVTFHGGGGAVAADPGLTVVDSNSPTLASATGAIGGFISGATLTRGPLGGRGSGFSNGTRTLSGTASLTTYENALDSVDYGFMAEGNPTGGGSHTSRTLLWSVNTGTSPSNTDTSTIETVHTAPTVTAGASATFTGGGGAAVLDSGLAVSDVDSGGVLSSATITVSGAITGDTLNFSNVNSTTEGNIAVASDSNGVLKLTSSGSTATLAQWQTALASVTYSFTPSDGDPTNGGGDTSRTIDWTVNDGVLNSGTATSTLNVTHVPPTITTSGTVTFDGGGGAVTLDSGVSITDPDSGDLLTSATVSIANFVSGDILSATTTGLPSIIVNYNTLTGTLTLAGTDTLADYRAVLGSLSFSFNPSDGDPTGGGSHVSSTIHWSINDGIASSGTTASTLNLVHVAPTVTASGTVDYGPLRPAAVLDSTLTNSDPDSGGNLTGATVDISSGFAPGDLLNFTAQNGIAVSGFNNGTLILTGTASILNYETALRSITYSSSLSDPTLGGTDDSRAISWSVNDGAAISAVSNSAVDVFACFVTETRIATADGPRPVETLRVGDLLLT